MKSFKQLNDIAGWLVFAVAATVYMLTAEPTGSLWDCGEFISAAYKLEVVHPPGAPLFLMIGRMFAWVAELLFGGGETIAYALNVMSGLSTAFMVLFIFWSTTILAKLSVVGTNREPETKAEIISILGAGVVAGLSATFATSVWFSAVEGEVYAMSAFFTGLVSWAGLRWYISTDPRADRWLIFIAYMVGLSIGVHLLSLLVIPFVALLYYYKYYTAKEDGTVSLVSSSMVLGIGMVILVFVQYFIIPKIPQMAAAVDFAFVNSLGLGLGTGIISFFVVLIGGIIAGLWYSHKIEHYNLNMALTMFAMVLVGFSTYGTIVIRANANPPINMNNPSDPYSLLSYLNREQYGDRPLFRGPHYLARPISQKETGKKYRPVKNEKTGKVTYQEVGTKSKYVYRPSDLMLFPRLGHMDRGRLYESWLGLKEGEQPSFGDNVSFFVNYQIGWMYVRYFMWNFVGRQNALQGYFEDDKTRGNWLSGLGFIDGMRLYDQSNLPKTVKEDKGRNTYYFLPLIFGLIGLFFHFSQRSKEGLAVLVLFIMTGLAIIVFLNQPPQEPRERDYAFAGSIFTFCIWIGMAVPAIHDFARKYLSDIPASLASFALVLSAPFIMGFQNWDDHSRAKHYAARDYARNFLESCAPNAILFTYGDNDTYPLWYAQEVEGIRTDVRVVNFSLLAVDWYIDQLRRKVNDSDKIEMTLPKAAYRGENRIQSPIEDKMGGKAQSAYKLLDFASKDHRPQDPRYSNCATYINSKSFYIPIDKKVARETGVIPKGLPDSLVKNNMFIGLGGKGSLIKDDLALIDIIVTNAKNGWKRPIYFAVTCKPEKLIGFKDYLQLEGLTLRLVAAKTPYKGGNLVESGRMELDKLFHNLTEDFRWGNLDKFDLFIDESYQPSIRSMQSAFIRLMQRLVKDGDKERAIKLIEKYFQGFPHMNFPYGDRQNMIAVIALTYAAGGQELGDEHARILAEDLADRQAFYTSLLDPAVRQGQFGRYERQNVGIARNLIEIAKGTTFADLPAYEGAGEETKQYIIDLFKQYGIEGQQRHPQEQGTQQPIQPGGE